MKHDLAEDKTSSLLRIASYLSKPQKFMAVTDARAEMRRTLAMAAQDCGRDGVRLRARTGTRWI